MFEKLLGLFYRPPDVVLGQPDDPYLLRWHIIPRNKWFNIYLHLILKDDEDRALHDHPWPNCSIVLKGGYLEVMPAGYEKWRKPGSVTFRKATASHRLVLFATDQGNVPAWSLFLTGPWERHWGFHCPKGWIPWWEFCDRTNPGLPGKGCGEYAD